MSLIQISFRLSLCLIFLSLPWMLISQPSEIVFHISEPSRIWIEGKSTIGKYDIEVREFTGQIAIPEEHFKGQNLESLENFLRGSVHISKDSLDAGGTLFNRHLRRTMRADQHPHIQFELKQLIVSDAGENPWQKIQIEGRLTVMEERKEVTFQMRGRWPDAALPEFQGSLQLDMTRFSIEPPTLFFGALQTDNIVTVFFHILLIQQDKNMQQRR